MLDLLNIGPKDLNIEYTVKNLRFFKVMTLLAFGFNGKSFTWIPAYELSLLRSPSTNTHTHTHSLSSCVTVHALKYHEKSSEDMEKLKNS